MYSLAISIIFCLTVVELVDTRSRIGAPYSITLGERELDELWLSSGGKEPSTYNNINNNENFERRSALTVGEERVFDLTNAARKKGRYCGSQWYPAAGELTWNNHLADAARQHAYDMLKFNYFSHTSIDGRSFSTRIKNAGYRNYCTVGENIAGNSNSASTVESWLNSPGHCANLMSNKFRDIGVGYAPGGIYGGYWVQNFGSSC